MIHDHIFREYDVRGVVGKGIDRSAAYALGKSFGSYLLRINIDAKMVSVGRDVRLTSQELSQALTDGITETGVSVCDIGICTTPMQYFSIFTLDLDGGVMVTGSHNPPEYNGFKLSVGKETIHGDAIQELRRIIRDETYISSSKKGHIESFDIVDAYKNYMLGEFSYLKDQRYRRLKIVVDAGNGTAGIAAPDIISNIGCDVISLYCDPDGRFPNHHPDPTVVEYIKDLVSETVRSQADMGVGYDGDADRIGIVSKTGDVIWGDQLMIILSREILKDYPAAKIIGDVKCSQLMFDDVDRHGGTSIMWKTGHSLIKKKMRDEKALIAGEFSGHIFIGDRYFGFDDAVYTTLRLIEIMKKTGKDIHELLIDVPRFFCTPEIRADCPDAVKQGVVAKIIEKFHGYMGKAICPHTIIGLDTTDGVRILFDKGWALVRMSNTQPVVVMRVEAQNEVSLAQYKAFLENEFRQAMEGI